MKFLWIVLIIVFAGCGGNSNSVEKIPSSPHTQDSSKTPPSIPNID